MIHNSPTRKSPNTDQQHNSYIGKLYYGVNFKTAIIRTVMTEREHKGDFLDVSRRYALDVAAVTL